MSYCVRYYHIVIFITIMEFAASTFGAFGWIWGHTSSGSLLMKNKENSGYCLLTAIETFCQTVYEPLISANEDKPDTLYFTQA